MQYIFYLFGDSVFIYHNCFKLILFVFIESKNNKKCKGAERDFFKAELLHV